MDATSFFSFYSLEIQGNNKYVFLIFFQKTMTSVDNN